MKDSIELSYDPDCPGLPPDEILGGMRVAARAAAAFHGVGDAEVSLVFASPDEMRMLNREHRGVDDVTDVLSFPQMDSGEDPGRAGARAGRPLLLGDVVLCAERAREQADAYGHGEAREFVYLFVHGLLHLLGFGHDSDAERAAMREAEERIMREAGL
jgi:probable rRNA maturation factor